jgi:diguanylate cyclase (GGDEF)-like protein
VTNPVGGVRDPDRLAAVARAELHGHLRDQDLNAVVGTLRIACRVPIAVVNIVSENLQTYPAEVGVGAPCTSVPDGLSFCAAVVDTCIPLSVSDARAHPVYCRNPMVLSGVIGAYAGVPLVDDGFILGSVSIFDGAPREFSQGDLEVLAHQTQLASSVLALRRSSRTDLLTGLPNRGVYPERLARALGRMQREGGAAAVMYLDVDGFKAINDTLGHDVGDWVLIEVAERLGSVLRPTDTLVRLGGDEFVAICEDLTRAQDAERVADRMVAATTSPWLLAGEALDVSVSIGIAVADVPTADPVTLLRAADDAMYRAKLVTGSSWSL